MADAHRPIDVALDAFVYVPVGLAVTVRDALPGLADRGRRKVTGRLSAAHLIGRFAVEQGRAQLRRAVADAWAGARGSDDGAAVEPAPAPAPPRRAPTETVPPAAGGPAVGDLAIPGYDSLSASQVLPRLDGLRPEELEDVRAYEAGHRGRKTILGRVAQLQRS